MLIWFFFVTAFVIASLYAVFFLYATIEWLKTRPLDTDPELSALGLSILVPFRNEKEHLEECIGSIIRQNYPRASFEIICIDDHSTDGSASIVKAMAEKEKNIRYVLNNGNGKKQAIKTGVSMASYNHLITTDADTARHSNWLRAFSHMFRYRGIRIITAPVLMQPSHNNAFQYMQAMDYCGMMALSATAMRKGWFRNGSGANMGFTRDLYLMYDDATDDKDTASGDDVFMLQFAAGYQPGCVLFPKNRDILVYTPAESGWNSFLRQRSRWAGKSFRYGEMTMTVIWAMIWVYHVILVALLVGAVLYGGTFIQLLAYGIITKFVADFIYLNAATNYFEKTLFKHFFIAELYHLIYVLIVGINAVLRLPFTWKDRKFKA